MSMDTKSELNVLYIALQESLELQTHYAKLLNMHDGGSRQVFSSPESWVSRLKEVGTVRDEITSAEKRLRELTAKAFTAGYSAGQLGIQPTKAWDDAQELLNKV